MGPGGLASPVAIACRADGAAAVAEYGSRRLLLLATDGSTQPLVPSPAWAVAFDGRGGLYYTDPVAGRLVRRLGETTSVLPLELSRPSGLAVSPDGTRAYVSERFGRLLEVDLENARVLRTLADELPGAEGLAWTAGNLFVSLPSQGRILQVSLKSGARSVFAEELELPTGLASDGTRLFVAETLSGAVWEYPLQGEGQRLAAQGSPGVCGLALAPDGSLLAVNILDGSVVRHRSSEERAVVVPPGAFPGGSLRFELENRLFLSGLTPVEFSSATGQTVYGPLLSTIYSSEEPLLGVVDSALAADGTVYYTLSEGGRIVTGWGDSLRVVTDGLEGPAGIVAGEQNTLYVAEADAGRVVAVVQGGGQVPLAVGLGEPVDLARVPEVGLIALDRRGGRLILVGSGVLASDLKDPTAVTALPDGTLAVLEAGADQVIRMDISGKRLEVLYRSEPGKLNPAEGLAWRVLGGLAVDPVSGTLFVSEPGTRSVVAVPLSR